MIGKQCLIVNSMTNRFDLVSQVLLKLVHDIQRIRSVITTEVLVLDRSRIAVVVHETPFSFVLLELLVRWVIQLNLL